MVMEFETISTSAHSLLSAIILLKTHLMESYYAQTKNTISEHGKLTQCRFTVRPLSAILA